MEAVSVSLETRDSLLYPGKQEAIIIPIGDVQLGPRLRGQPRAAHLKRLKRVLDWGVEHGAYFVGMGDMADVASPSNREALRAARLYDTVRDTLEQGAESTLEELKELLEPTRGRWLGMVEGHHLWPFEDGTTTDTRLADFVGCRFLGSAGLITARLPAEGQHKQPILKISAWHGEGGGGTLGAPLSKLERMVGDREADIYMMGHYHKALAAKKPRLGSIGGERGGDPRIVHKDLLLVVTGSFMRSYLQGSKRDGRAGGGYAEKAGMSPAALGVIACFVRPRRDRDGYVEVDLDYASL